MCLLFFLFFSSWWMAQDHSSWKCKNHPRCLHFPHCKHLIDAKSSRPYFSACDSLDLYYWYYMYRSISIHGLECFHSLPIVLSYSIPIPHPYSRLFIMWLRPFQLYFFLLLYPISLFAFSHKILSRMHVILSLTYASVGFIPSLGHVPSLC